MRFGVHLPHFARYGTTDNIRRVAEEAEVLGFDSVWVSDHVVDRFFLEGHGSLQSRGAAACRFAVSALAMIHFAVSVCRLIQAPRAPITKMGE